jgi:hypothetical protein
MADVKARAISVFSSPLSTQIHKRIVHLLEKLVCLDSVAWVEVHFINALGDVQRLHMHGVKMQTMPEHDCPDEVGASR